MKKLLVAIGLLMSLTGYAYGQFRNCPTHPGICGFQILNCVTLSSKCPFGQCGNPDQAACCLYENGYCPITGTLAETIVCGNSCNP